MGKITFPLTKPLPNPALTAGDTTQQVTVVGNAIQLATCDSPTISATLDVLCLTGMERGWPILVGGFEAPEPELIRRGRGQVLYQWS